MALSRKVWDDGVNRFYRMLSQAMIGYPLLVLLLLSACRVHTNQATAAVQNNAVAAVRSVDWAGAPLTGPLRPAPQAVTPTPLAPGTATVIGYSTGGLPIESYTFGDGLTRVAFIGGIHGGTEWNTILLAYTAIDYFTKHPRVIPATLTLHIVPSANPDGQKLVTGSWGRFQARDVRAVAGGRFNQNGVDLNRNWGCDWAAEAWWGAVQTSGGTAPFSEQETRVLRDFLMDDWHGRGAVQGVVFWHSAVPGVFAGGCTGKYALAERLAAAYARAAAYPYGKSFTQYPITGDATNWLATQQIPAIIVELATNTSMEWPQNRAGMLAVLAQLAMTQTESVAADEPGDAPRRGFVK